MDSALDFGTPLPHIVLNVEQEWLLPEVSIHNLPRCLQAYGGVEVGLRRRMMSVRPLRAAGVNHILPASLAEKLSPKA